jgi:hypothetical protein
MVTIIHLHNTSDNLFWDLKNLDVVESHVEDPLYKTPRTKELLDIHDKVLKAPIANAQFDYLISQKIGSEDPEKVAVEWQNIRKGRTDPKSYLEDIETMSSRLKKLIKFFGEEKIRYAGLECGLKSHPTYDCALECLRRQSIAVKKLENN